MLRSGLLLGKSRSWNQTDCRVRAPITNELLGADPKCYSFSPFSVSIIRTRRTWPFNEQVIDVIHKGVYAFTTGYVVDRWLH
jgi:hypothetical protein